MANGLSIPAERLIQIKDIFRRFGYRSPSMLDIATELAISKNTLYSYAVNKEELIQKTIASLRKEFLGRGQVIKNQSQEDQQIFENWFQLFIDFHQEFSFHARQDLSNFYPTAEQGYLKFKQELMQRFQDDLLENKTLELGFAIKTIDRQIEEIVHKQFQIESNGSSALLKIALDYHWSAVIGILKQ